MPDRGHFRIKNGIHIHQNFLGVVPSERFDHRIDDKSFIGQTFRSVKQPNHGSSECVQSCNIYSVYRHLNRGEFNLHVRKTIQAICPNRIAMVIRETYAAMCIRRANHTQHECLLRSTRGILPPAKNSVNSHPQTQCGVICGGDFKEPLITSAHVFFKTN